MATKKDVIEEVVDVQDPWKNMVKMYIPRTNYGGKSREEIIRVNDVGFCIFWNGTQQELPEPIAEIVKSVMEARAREEDFREGLPTASAPENKL